MNLTNRRACSGHFSENNNNCFAILHFFFFLFFCRMSHTEKVVPRWHIIGVDIGVTWHAHHLDSRFEDEWQYAVPVSCLHVYMCLMWRCIHRIFIFANGSHQTTNSDFPYTRAASDSDVSFVLWNEILHIHSHTHTSYTRFDKKKRAQNVCFNQI